VGPDQTSIPESTTKQVWKKGSFSKEGHEYDFMGFNHWSALD
jgi:hypothetical protein